MKTFFLSILAAISSFLGINRSEPITSTTTLISPEITQTEMSPAPSIIETITLMPTQVNKPLPTATKLTSSINQEVLKTVFGLQDQQQINYILSSTDEMVAYQQKYYEKFKNFPVPKITITSPTQHIAMPTKDGFTVCTGEQLQLVYSEIEKVEKEIEYEKMDYECHHDPSKQETEECRIWRRENDQNNVKSTGTVDDKIADYQQKLQKMSARQSIYDQLLEKYCSLG